MARDKVINVLAFGTELGKLGYDLDSQKSFFQYNPDFLDSGLYAKFFPFIFKRTKSVQVFKEYQGDTFQGLPPMIADSLPDAFGNIIFQEWLDARGIQMLTKQLRELEADGLVHREIFAEIPPRVEYSVTEKGKTLFPIIKSMSTWREKHITDV